MTSVTILHNPRCSKSRQTLQLIEAKGIKPQIIEYLKNPISREYLEEIINKLQISQVREIMRVKEAEYKEQNLNDENLSEEDLIQAMLTTPKLLERPIVITQQSARIGRPPEKVLEIL